MGLTQLVFLYTDQSQEACRDRGRLIYFTWRSPFPNPFSNHGPVSGFSQAEEGGGRKGEERRSVFTYTEQYWQYLFFLLSLPLGKGVLVLLKTRLESPPSSLIVFINRFSPNGALWVKTNHTICSGYIANNTCFSLDNQLADTYNKHGSGFQSFASDILQ